MSEEIEQRLEVKAPRERVWRFLLDPNEVVTCLPGAELLEMEDARHFTGRVKVKVGPITVAYKGKARLTEVDEAAGLIRMEGEGTEQAGPGSARVVMDCHVTTTAAGATEVRVVAKLDLVGRIVQLGRGMIKGVAEQVFKQFAASLRARLEVPEAAAPIAVPAPVDAPAPADPGSRAEGPAPAPAAPATPVARPEARPVKPVSGLALVGRALLEALRRLVRRLFGRGPA